MDKVRKRLNELRKLAGVDKFVVCFSGGKDSTVLLHLVLEELIEDREIELLIVFADTLVENPLMQKHVLKTIKDIQDFVSKERLKVNVIIATPSIDSTFWVNLVGKGYPLPHIKFRWCQDKLKIKPIKRALKSYVGNAVMLVASRMGESGERKRSIVKRIGANFELERNSLRVFAPMYDVKENEVWDFLSSHIPLYGESYSNVFKLYEEGGGKGKTRFGCWVCSIVRRDKTLQNQIKIYPYLIHYYNFRNFLLKFTADIKNRYPFARNGRPAKNGMGCLTLSARKVILDRLMELENLLGRKLILAEELTRITEIWQKDRERISVLLRQY